jgi:flavin reductase (DIM6/NTAB) family NADH-FMN oxidoreductase RutF
VADNGSAGGHRPIARLPRPPTQRLSRQASQREVMAQFATGVTVLTAGGRDGHGMTANAFTSVSLEPPLVLCCVAKAARMHEVIMSARSFAVSVLAGDQQEVARHFADSRRPRGQAQFDAIEWVRGPRTGTPLVAGALGWLECELVKVYGGGDHSIFVGEVLEATRGVGDSALLFHGGRFEHTGTVPAHDRKAIS